MTFDGKFRGTRSSLIVLDRDPVDDIERLIVNAFKQVRTVHEIWIRYRPADLTYGAPKDDDPRNFARRTATVSHRVVRVYLSFSIIDPNDIQRMKDIKTGEFAQHVRGMSSKHPTLKELEFEFFGLPVGKIPPDIPARVWIRDREVHGLLEQ